MRPVSGSNSCRRLDFVVEQLDAHRHFRVLGREDVDRVAAHAERAARKSVSLRVYCMAISRAMMSRWPILSPVRSVRIIL
jgi:hypothetical protein